MRKVDVGQSNYKQYRPGRGVVEIVSGMSWHDIYNPIFLFSGAEVSLRIPCKLLQIHLNEQLGAVGCILVLVVITVSCELMSKVDSKAAP